MNRIFRWMVRSLFAPVTGSGGAVASTLGFFLGFLPLYSARIPLLLAVSLLFRLNIIALFFGTLITIFIPMVRHLPFLNLEAWEGYMNEWLSSTLKTKIQVSQSITTGILGGLIGLVCFFFFHWFYNLGLKKSERNQEHVFLDSAKRRWSIIIRMTTGFSVFILLVSMIFIDSLFSDPIFPELHLNQTAKTSGIVPMNQPLNEKQLATQVPKTNPTPLMQKSNVQGKELKSKQEVYGYYVNWDENSKTSFKKNIDSITTLIPEWLQLTPDLSLKTSTDPSITAEAKKHQTKILPLVNNFFHNKWDGEMLHRLFTTPWAEDRFIQQLLAYVRTNHFDGINIDFEEIQPRDKANLTDFIDKVSKVFHQNGLMVTMDVPPMNNNFDYASLAADVDRMMVMLYDQHNSTSKPGPVAPTDWLNESINQLQSAIPSEKLIVSLGNFGYDWQENSKWPAETLTFGEIMELGMGTNLQIHWNKQAGNPYFRYKLDGENHMVWFLDGATFYNQMKAAMASGSKGIAVWRLGSEDPAIWNYMNQPKKIDNPANAIKTIVSPDPVQYTGDGEILKIASPSQNGKRTIVANSQGWIQNETYSQLPMPFEVERYGNVERKKVVLTFDDGPDPKYTPQILDILDKNHIKGAFFIVGQNALQHPELVKRMYREGHEIGSHTFTHPNVASTSPTQTKMELNANQRLFQEITGHSMNLFRPPYVADAEPSSRSELLPILRAQEMGYTMVGETIDSEDWQRPSSKEIVNRVLEQLPEGNVILMHDAGGDRSNTVKALPMLIKELKQRGYTFTTIAQLIGKSNQEIMPPADEDRPYFVYDKAIFMLVQGWRLGLSILFYSAIGLGILRLVVFVFLSRKQVKRVKKTVIDPSFTPFVSVVIAAYNEEKVICKTIDSILSSDYANFEVLVIDDGSMDLTAGIVEKNYANHPQVRLIKKLNGGKSSAVNLGFREAKGEIVVALDADTVIAENAISLLVNHFKNEKVAAVSGNVKVGNKGNLLTNWQHIEYVTGFNLERRAFATLNCITVVPGAIGAWRKAAVEEAGYFQEDTLAEDTDITLTLLRQGKKIEFEERAYAFTEVPEDLKSLAKQRYRWVYGTLQCLWKHRGALFNKKHPSLGYIGLPNMWLFQYLYQTISPIADLLFIVALFGEHPGRASIGFILFYLLDFATSLYAFRLEKESPKPLASLFLQRILYKQLMTYVVIKSIFSAIKGVTVGWNKLKRNGSVTQEAYMTKVEENM
ncbi:polysaccharide deacetylase family protein [Neobacillus niacini]|uniref:polysaccharide deacetylase family protein n=1 Tax=Neobacillus niacini TaxID=86668 RepID=UPI002864B165|nr:polysaccharide deacetylase family protein [Neobacillus niacini]MDR7002096.1 cellulose synthase/poly-beta-1,6-N-acetylglucosamine synthase-like glycosyltransferase/spore germination protein YaaH/peptidoglycan/xylan/chitin deacetylase (PgdA/CDA1 family) [Neobacillus niacini]